MRFQLTTIPSLPEVDLLCLPRFAGAWQKDIYRRGDGRHHQVDAPFTIVSELSCPVRAR